MDDEPLQRCSRAERRVHSSMKEGVLQSESMCFVIDVWAGVLEGWFLMMLGSCLE